MFIKIQQYDKFNKDVSFNFKRKEYFLYFNSSTKLKILKS